MSLVNRATRSRDLTACASLIHDRLLFSGAELPELIRLWREILDRDAGYSGIVIPADGAAQPVAFGISAFVERALADRLATDPEPFVARRLFDAWRDGAWPFLDAQATARANAGAGVDVLILHRGIAEGLPQPELDAAQHALMGSFASQHAGLNLRSVTCELYRDVSARVGQSGYRLRRDFRDHPAVAHLPPGRRPSLIGLRREEAAGQAGNFLTSSLFLYHARPRFVFDALQRRLLRLALEDDSNELAAEEMHLSLSTIKKRWTSIYERIADVDPAALPLGSAGGRKHGAPSGRGVELKRYVLRYIREHPEELHPFMGA